MLLKPVVSCAFGVLCVFDFDLSLQSRLWFHVACEQVADTESDCSHQLISSIDQYCALLQ